MQTEVMNPPKVGMGDRCGAQNQGDCNDSCRGSGDVNAPTQTRRQRHVAPREEVLQYDNNAVIARIMQEMGISEEEANALFKDTLLFLWLAASFGGVVPSTRIDEGWHTFLLFTRDYQEFCQQYFGEFIHHRPRRPEDVPDGGALRERTKALIAEHLGDNLGANWSYKVLASGDCEQSCSPSRDCNGGSQCR